MPSNVSKGTRLDLRQVALVLVCLGLGLGWVCRERVFASAESGRAGVKSGTVNLGEVAMAPYSDAGKVVGQVGTYFNGETAASSQFVTGRFVLEAGQSPHPPHVHVEEEVMVIESGVGEIFCDGKTTKIGPGSTMYTAPNVPHGIVNTGDKPIVFTFIKWAPGGGKAR